MAQKSRPNPDGILDVDRGSSSNPRVKVGAFLMPEQVKERVADRVGQRELDVLVEKSSALSRPSKDRERATPRETSAPLGHPLKARPMPQLGQTRTVMSSRQRDARSKTKFQVQDTLSGAQHHELRRLLVDDRGRWEQVNDALSDAAGDVQQLDEPTVRAVQRVDRAIQAYEASNDRGHLVYCNVQMPPYVNTGNVDGYARNHFTVGQELAFDRFTVGSHCMHELELDDRDNQRTLAIEAATRRGMYLGRSGRGNDTSHLLPRGMRLWVTGTGTASYQRPDGSTGSRTVVQVTDTPPAA